NWFSEEHNLVFITDCFLRILHAAYEELQATLLPYQIKGHRSLQLRDYIVKQRGPFSKEDIRKRFPTVSESTFQRTFQCLQEQHKITLLSKGRTAKWSTVTEETGTTT
ncbi:cell filamentation protein Fic, partial [Bacillus cereus]|nr:cell filamentation protein Fic [Bacillus cereus]